MATIDLKSSLGRLLEGNVYTWCVTGAAGFIGSHICQALLLSNQKVKALDNLSTGKIKNIDFLRTLSKDNFEFLEGDINDQKALLTILKNCDFVLHQAALGSVPRSVNEPMTSHHSNVTGFINLLDNIRSNFNTQIRRVVYASSSSVYGDSSTLPKREGEEGKVISPYAATKRIDEIYADAFVSCYEMSLVGLRYFNVFGARQDPEGPYAAVIPKWINALMSGEKPIIYGDGETSRDFCYIDNVVFANISSALSKKFSRGHFALNIGCGESTTLNTLYQEIAKIFANETGSISIIEPERKDFRAGDVRASLADISKASELIDFEPMVKVTEGLALCIPSYLKG